MKTKLIKMRIVENGSSVILKPDNEAARMLTYITRRDYFTLEDVKVLTHIGLKVETKRSET